MSHNVSPNVKDNRHVYGCSKPFHFVPVFKGKCLRQVLETAEKVLFLAAEAQRTPSFTRDFSALSASQVEERGFSALS
jgi:hypothetical protein